MANVHDEVEVTIRSCTIHTEANTTSMPHAFCGVGVVLQKTCCCWVLCLVFDASVVALALRPDRTTVAAMLKVAQVERVLDAPANFPGSCGKEEAAVVVLLSSGGEGMSVEAGTDLPTLPAPTIGPAFG